MLIPLCITPEEIQWYHMEKTPFWVLVRTATYWYLKICYIDVHNI
jgi:hypothetical protein